MDLIDMLWLEDEKKIVSTVLDSLYDGKEELGFSIVPFHYTSKAHFDKESGLELNALVMGLVCIDYNLPGGVNGNEIIKQIRSHKANKKIPIIFYSAMKTEIELEEILKNELDNLDNIYFAHKDTLEDRIIYILT
jgi:CheY-like chemotaxis protein